MKLADGENQSIAPKNTITHRKINFTRQHQQQK